jgi:hypothetical protein
MSIILGEPTQLINSQGYNEFGQTPVSHFPIIVHSEGLALLGVDTRLDHQAGGGGVMKRKSVQRVCLASAFVFLASLACSPRDGTAPSITITGPASGSSVNVGEAVEIVSMSVADEGVERVDLFVNGERVRYDEPPSGNPTTFSIAQPWTPGEAGEVTIGVVVFDTAGQESEQVEITLVVLDGIVEVPPGEAEETPVPPVDGGGCTLNASYVADVTVPDDTEFAPGEAFDKAWRIRNSGTCDWGPGFSLVFVSGDQMGGGPVIPVPAVAAGSDVELGDTMTAPMAPGTYRGNWRMQSDEGVVFGSTVYVRIIVPTEQEPPTDLVALVQADRTVLFEWTDAVGEEGYHYEFSFTKGSVGSTESAGLPADTTSWTSGILECEGDGSFTIIALAPGGSEIGRTTVTFQSGACAGFTWNPNLTIIAPQPTIFFLLPRTEQFSEQVSVPGNQNGYVTAECPSNGVVVGGGYSASSQLFVYGSTMDSNGWKVFARNDGSSSQTLSAYAVCLFNTAGTSVEEDGQASVPGGQTGDAIATCPPGSVVTGGGFAQHSSGDLYIYNSTPFGNGWRAYADNPSGSSQLFSVYATCLSGTSGTTTQVHGTTLISAGGSGFADGVCTSGLITGGGFAGSDDMDIYAMYMVSGSVWRTRAINISGAGGLNSYAMCLTFP